MHCAMNAAGLPALLVDLESLAELVSIGTLFVFFTLSAAVLWRRHCEASGPSMHLHLSMLGLCTMALGAASCSPAAKEHLHVGRSCRLVIAPSTLVQICSQTCSCLTGLTCANSACRLDECAAGASLSFTFGAPIVVPALFLLTWLLATASFCFMPTICKGVQFSVPWCPFIPSLAMLANLHLIGKASPS